MSHVHEDQVFCVALLPTVAGRLLRPHEGGCRVLDTVEPPTGKVALSPRGYGSGALGAGAAQRRTARDMVIKHNVPKKATVVPGA